MARPAAWRLYGGLAGGSVGGAQAEGLVLGLGYCHATNCAMAPLVEERVLEAHASSANLSSDGIASFMRGQIRRTEGSEISDETGIS